MIKKEEEKLVGQTKEIDAGPPKLVESPLPAVTPFNPGSLPVPEDTSPKPPQTPRFHPIKYEEVMKEKARKRELKERIKSFKKSRELKKQEQKKKEVKKPEPKKLVKEKKPVDKEKIRKWVVIFLLLVVAAALIAVYFLGLEKESPEKQLLIGENIDYAYIRDDVLSLRLLPVDFSTVEKINFIISGESGEDYVYSSYSLEFDHELYPEDFNLESLEKAVGVSADFEYFPPEPKSDVNESEDQTPAASPAPPKGGGGGGGGSVPPPPESGCTNDSGCISAGEFCRNNTPYACTLGGDGCYDRTDKAECGPSQKCLNGACQVVPDCILDSDCTIYFNDCSYGICNSTGKCEIRHNSSLNLCRPAAGECDLDEVCSGSGESCPADAFKPDGTSCQDGKGVCDSGVCVVESSCGDGACDSEEDCSSCPDDCACVSPVPYCSEGVCVECLEESHCSSGEVCSGNTCVDSLLCGNGILDSGEECDGEDFKGKTCEDFFIHSNEGTLQCCEGCERVDLSQCRNYTYTFCVDYDLGKNYNMGSSVSANYNWRRGPNCTSELSTGFGSGSEYYSDVCSGDILIEYYCETDKSPAFEERNCSAEGKVCRYNSCSSPIFPTASFWEGIKELIKRI
jgi:Cys-rich repeat protein